MRGTVIKRGKSWAVVVDVGRDPFTGRRIRRWHSGYATKRDAERARTEVLSRLDHGTYVEPDRRALGPYLEVDWLPAMRARVRASTWDSYARNIRLHIVPALGGVALQALTPARLNEFYAALLEEGRKDGRGGLAPKTVRYLHGILRKALADAVRWNLLQRNVADQADAPSPRSGAAEMMTWGAEELGHFLDFVGDDRLYGAWVLAATTGLRRGEVLGLRWSDVDLDSGRLAVRQTLVSVAYETKFSTPKTNRGRRSVSIDAHDRHSSSVSSEAPARGSPGVGSRIPGLWSRRHTRERRARPPRSVHAAVRQARQELRTTPHPPARLAAHPRHACPRRWRSSKGGERAARPRHGCVHA